MFEYLTMENIYPALKFIGVLATGLYTGASIYLGSSHMPSMLAMSDMNQALVQFQYFWPRERQLVTTFSFFQFMPVYIKHRICIYWNIYRYHVNSYCNIYRYQSTTIYSSTAYMQLIIQIKLIFSNKGVQEP